MSEFAVATRMQRHDLHKLHGLGNDFLIWFRPVPPVDAAEVARRWCDRTTGIGADGLIIAIDHRTTPRFVLFNADGSRAEVSGNGLRCFGHAIAARRGVEDVDLVVETDVGERQISVNDALAKTANVTVGMGAPGPGPAIEGVDLANISGARVARTIDIGNPHIVVEVAEPAEHDISVVGPAIEAHFQPIGINVHLAKPTERGVRMVTWERGVGATDACGSGACAAAALAHLDRPNETRFLVEMPGGTAAVEVGETLTLRGPSTYVAAIEPAVWS